MQKHAGEGELEMRKILECGVWRYGRNASHFIFIEILRSKIILVNENIFHNYPRDPKKSYPD